MYNNNSNMPNFQDPARRWRWSARCFTYLCQILSSISCLLLPVMVVYFLTFYIFIGI